MWEVGGKAFGAAAKAWTDWLWRLPVWFVQRKEVVPVDLIDRMHAAVVGLFPFEDCSDLFDRTSRSVI